MKGTTKMTRGQRLNVKDAGLWMIAILIILGCITAQQGYAEQERADCTLATLNGLYVFDGTGYNIIASSPQPKAVVEFLDFKGDGTLTSLATISVNGMVKQGIPGAGSYTVAEDCTGTLTFNPKGPHFDIFIAPNRKEYHMIQTDSNTVLAGVSRRVSR
jgi:hypothetical protein